MAFWKKKNKRVELELRAPKKRRSFFEKKEKSLPNLVFSRIIFRLLALIFIGATIYVLFFSPFLEIKKISLEGIDELKYEDVHNKINENFSGKYLHFIPKNNLILILGNKIESDLLENFKKISSVEIKKNFPDGITVRINERKELLVWCSNDPCYIIDENGFAFAQADFESEEIKQNNLLTLRDSSGKEVHVGEKVLDEYYINFVVSLKDELLKETGITITGEYQTGSRIAEEVKVQTDEGWGIYFSSSLPMENSLRTLTTFLGKEIDQEKRGKLEYIDLRAENKVYYKFKDEENANQDQNSKENNSDKKEEKKKK
jgi:cell division septal protein FtsQ